ncbi:AMP-binding protein [Sulfobacillus acidophilus]|uniref:AMP-binding protein n=1 Tax=Sulfobacillus acidophilus TaxID=53633 RepID=A0ABS3AVG3_9FIRM|nr:AMP-binding protein [Sulfobacillus acidophilus]
MKSSVDNTDKNIASFILLHAKKNPDKTAIIIPKNSFKDEVISEEKISFYNLSRRVRFFQNGLKKAGFNKGDRIIVMFDVSINLFAFLLALFSLGMVAVFIDIGMSFKNILSSIKSSQAKAIVSVNRLLKYAFFIPPLWKLKKYCVDKENIFLRPFSDLYIVDEQQALVKEVNDASAALITFTSGSTGRPKGANRTHGLLVAQHKALLSHFLSKSDDVDMPCFPVVTLHNLCCGVTTVLPFIDFKKPKNVNAALIFNQIKKYGVNRICAPPSFMEKIVKHVQSTKENTDQIRQIGVGADPVSKLLCSKIVNVFNKADCQVIYGSTESEPISSILMSEILSAKGEGNLVGKAAKVCKVEIVNLPKNVHEVCEKGIENYRANSFERGEICVSGPHVNKGYINNKKANEENKIFAKNNIVWHRTGDIGYFDEHENIWLVGRKNAA